jgi:hypothetical protein
MPTSTTFSGEETIMAHDGTVYIYDTAFPEWKASSPVAEWPHGFLVTFYSMMEKVAMQGSPQQRQQMMYFSLLLCKEAGGDRALVDALEHALREKARPRQRTRRRVPEPEA